MAPLAVEPVAVEAEAPEAAAPVVVPLAVEPLEAAAAAPAAAAPPDGVAPADPVPMSEPGLAWFTTWGSPMGLSVPVMYGLAQLDALGAGGEVPCDGADGGAGAG